MVAPGQFLERPTLIPVGAQVLEGLSHRGEKRPGVLILPPPPDEGGSMDHVVAAEVAWAAATRGFPTLRFNYRGVGASQGTRGRGPELEEDALAARMLIEENIDGGGVYAVAVGGSARAALWLMEREPGLAGMCWVSPVEVSAEDVARVTVPLLVLVGADDLRLPRVAFSEAVAQAGGRFELVPGADQSFSKNLAQVGQLVAQHLGSNRFVVRS